MARGEWTGMTAAEVVDLYADLQSRGAAVWVDGGWGVDALLGTQSRVHSDLDLAIERRHLAILLGGLGERGFRESQRDSEWNFMLSDGGGRQVDVHVFRLGADRNVACGIPYPSDSLSGAGVIQGHRVRCISPEWSVKFHCGYRITQKDFHDVSALCRKFGLALPDEYLGFEPSHPARA